MGEPHLSSAENDPLQPSRKNVLLLVTLSLRIKLLTSTAQDVNDVY